MHGALYRREIYDMGEDLIFVNTDPDFNTALRALRELEKATRLETKNHQEAWLDVIQSNVEGDDKIFKFGGDLKSPGQHAFAFGRTASAVFRMVMLRAVGIEEKFWPGLGPNTMRRNKEALRFAPLDEQFPNGFKLLDGGNANNETARARAQGYIAKCKQVFPHSLISERLLENEGKNVCFHNTMLIFRNNLEVIIIETTANATMYPSSELGWVSKREFDSDVIVTCTRKTIMPGEDGEHFKKLKALPPGAGQEQAQPMGRGRERKEVLKQLRADMAENKKLEELKKNKGSSVDQLTNVTEHLRTTDSSGVKDLPATDSGDNEPTAD